MDQCKQFQLTHEHLGQFQGDDVRYRHELNARVIYTPGVKFLGEQGGALLADRCHRFLFDSSNH